MRLCRMRFLFLFPLMLAVAPMVLAAEGDDPYVKLSRCNKAWRRKVIRLPSFTSVRCTRKD